MCLIGHCIEHVSVTASAANIDGDSGGGPWAVVVPALSAKEECFGVCQFAFKSSETLRSKNGILGPTRVSIPCHHASWLLTNRIPAIRRCYTGS